MGSQVNEKKRDRKASFFLYKASYTKHRGFLLRKHCKEGASVAIQFLTCYEVEWPRKYSEVAWFPKHIGPSTSSILSILIFLIFFVFF